MWTGPHINVSFLSLRAVLSYNYFVSWLTVEGTFYSRKKKLKEPMTSNLILTFYQQVST